VWTDGADAAGTADVIPDGGVDDPETFAILGAALTVHRTMGGGLFERAYALALRIELRARSIPHVIEPPIELSYRGHPVGCYRPDFICYASVVVEVKASAALVPGHYAQAMHYLMAQGASRALLINFCVDRLRWKRFVHPSHERLR
jgi:GxxExxY protein